MLREELRIKDARLGAIPALLRPHYPPAERLAILALKAARGWNNAQTARAILLTAATIASWLKRLAEAGPDALVQLPQPVNRFPEYVAMLVQQLKSACPVMGKVRMARDTTRKRSRQSHRVHDQSLEWPSAFSGRPEDSASRPDAY